MSRKRKRHSDAARNSAARREAQGRHGERHDFDDALDGAYDDALGETDDDGAGPIEDDFESDVAFDRTAREIDDALADSLDEARSLGKPRPGDDAFSLRHPVGPRQPLIDTRGMADPLDEPAPRANESVRTTITKTVRTVSTVDAVAATAENLTAREPDVTGRDAVRSPKTASSRRRVRDSFDVWSPRATMTEDRALFWRGVNLNLARTGFHATRWFRLIDVWRGAAALGILGVLCTAWWLVTLLKAPVPAYASESFEARPLGTIDMPYQPRLDPPPLATPTLDPPPSFANGFLQDDWQTPAFEPPAYEVPNYDPPQYDPPQYEIPEYDTPAYAAPVAGRGNPFSIAVRQMALPSELAYAAPVQAFSESFANELLSLDRRPLPPNRWTRHQARPAALALETDDVRSYADRPGVQVDRERWAKLSQLLESASEPAVRDAADGRVSFELSTEFPASAAPGQPTRAQVVVINEAADAARVLVRVRLDPLERVIATSPEAAVAGRELVWLQSNWPSGQERTFTIQFKPDARPIEAVASVEAVQAASVRTNVGDSRSFAPEGFAVEPFASEPSRGLPRQLQADQFDPLPPFNPNAVEPTVRQPVAPQPAEANPFAIGGFELDPPPQQEPAASDADRALIPWRPEPLVPWRPEPADEPQPAEPSFDLGDLPDFDDFQTEPNDAVAGTPLPRGNWQDGPRANNADLAPRGPVGAFSDFELPPTIARPRDESPWDEDLAWGETPTETAPQTAPQTAPRTTPEMTPPASDFGVDAVPSFAPSGDGWESTPPLDSANNVRSDFGGDFRNDFESDFRTEPGRANDELSLQPWTPDRSPDATPDPSPRDLSPGGWDPSAAFGDLPEPAPLDAADFGSLAVDDGTLRDDFRPQQPAAVPQTTLELAVRMTPSQTLGEPHPVIFEIRNVGPVVARDVQLLVTLPTVLTHRNGRVLELSAGDIAPGRSYKTRLTTTADALGEGQLVSRIDSESATPKEAKPRVRIVRVGEVAAVDPIVTNGCVCK